MHWENRDEAYRRVAHLESVSPLSGLDEKDMAEPVYRAIDSQPISTTTSIDLSKYTE